MPLYVSLKVNEELIQKFFISRMSGQSTDPNSVNEYSIVVTETFDDTTGKEWSPSWGDYVNGDHFTHRYGDGASECLRHGMNAWHSLGKKIY